MAVIEARAGRDRRLRERAQGLRQSRSSISRTRSSSSRNARRRRPVAKVFVDDCMDLHLAGKLDATMAAMAKLYLTDAAMQDRRRVPAALRRLRLHERISRSRGMYADSRVQKIYGGTNEIMKLLIARSLLSCETSNLRKETNPMTRMLHLRRRAHAARQRPQGRLAARSDARCVWPSQALQAIRDRNKLDTHAGRRRRAGLRRCRSASRAADIARTAVLNAGYAETRLGRADQPLLRLAASKPPTWRRRR